MAEGKGALADPLVDISIVIPIYNESANLSELHGRLAAALARDFPNLRPEIIFVDDGSTDGSFAELEKLHNQDPNIRGIKFTRNFGHHIAITAGLDHAAGRYVVLMDGDLQDQPEEIVKLFCKLSEGYDVVFGERRQKKFGPLKKLNSWLFGWVMSKLLDDPICMNSSIFRIMTSRVLAEARKLREHNRYIIGILGWVGYRHTSVPVEHGARHKGHTKYDFGRQWRLALNAIFSFSNRPLALIKVIGVALIASALAPAAGTLAAADMAAIQLLVISALVMLVSGIQVLVLAVLGEYIGRIYVESKARPLYVVERTLHD